MSAAPRSQGPLASWRVVRFGAIDSTNEEARCRARAGDAGRLWIVAEEQSAGRGRRGRSWVSLKGNLFASALIIDPCLPAIAAQLGFVAGVALARAAVDVGVAEVGLKWPNDLLFNGAKCAGLLVEGLSLSDGRLACIIGVGVNCARATGDLDHPTAFLTDRRGKAVAPSELFQRLIARFDEALGEWRAGGAFERIRSAWLDRAAGLGGPIRIDDAGGRREGVFEGLDADGRLLFRGERGVEAVESAELWILPAPDSPPIAAPSDPLAREGRV